MWQMSSWARRHRRWTTPIVVIALLAGSLTPPLVKPVAAASGDWPQFHDGPTHEG